MEYQMRRGKQQLSCEECIAILKNNTSGVLSLIDTNGYPYGVPLSYVFHEGKLIFHGTNAGQKMDAIATCDKASFCVIDRDDVVPEKFTTHYRSVIAFGNVRVLIDPEEIVAKVSILAQKYAPGHMDRAEGAIKGAMKAMAVFELDIENLTGKSSLALIDRRPEK